MIVTEDRPVLEPLVRSALEHEKKLVQLGIARTRQRLAEFERLYAMTSDEFERRLWALELAETPEMTDWRMEIGMLQMLEHQYTVLKNARVN
jgi:hypothetical protein